MGPPCKIVCIVGTKAYYVNIIKLLALLTFLFAICATCLYWKRMPRIRSKVNALIKPSPKICNNCFHYNYKDLINPEKICEGGKDIFMVMMITTVPSAYAARIAIRSTWARHSINNTGTVRHVFLFGRTNSKKDQAVLQLESSVYGDIWQGDFDDNYYNLTLKAIGGFQWVLRACPRARFIMRTADDCYINVPEVTYLYEKHGAMLGKSISGPCIGAVNRPIRQKKSRWYVSEKAYPRDVYPPYCIGTAFMLSRNFTLKFLKASTNVPFFTLEDVYFGLMMEHMKVTGINVPGFNVFWTVVRNQPLTLWYTLHYVKPNDMKSIWELENGRFKSNLEFHKQAKDSILQ